MKGVWVVRVGVPTEGHLDYHRGGRGSLPLCGGVFEDFDRSYLVSRHEAALGSQRGQAWLQRSIEEQHANSLEKEKNTWP